MRQPTMTHTKDEKTIWHGRTKAQVPMRYKPLPDIKSDTKLGKKKTVECKKPGTPHPMPAFDAMIRARKVREAVKAEAKKKREAQ